MHRHCDSGISIAAAIYYCFHIGRFSRKAVMITTLSDQRSHLVISADSGVQIVTAFANPDGDYIQYLSGRIFCVRKCSSRG